MFEVLMICTGNICRSPMAEGLLRHMLPAWLQDRVTVRSAGTHALHGRHAEPYAIDAMARHGIDISDHRARLVNREMVRRAGVILTMEQSQLTNVRRMMGWSKSHAKLLTDFGPEPDGSDVEDPYGGPLEAYLLCLQDIRPCIEGLAAELDDVFTSIEGEK